MRSRRSRSGNRGAWSLPEGVPYYANRLKNSTTTDLTADQIHTIGLAQVARNHREMERIKAQVGFTGTLQQFFKHIIDDPKFEYPNTEAGRQQYLADARRYIAQVMDASPKWFRRLPKAPLEVRAVEKWREETAAVAFYNSPSEDGSRPGIYYVNLADMRQVLKPQIEAISYHEGAPGHHFQIALAQELPDVPKFRRFGGYGAYAEGWGLYSEGLARRWASTRTRSPSSACIRRSCGARSGWSSTPASTPSAGAASRRSTISAPTRCISERDATKEVERYFNSPGQATSYMIGQLKILELRDRAKQALGAKFDIRDFHAVVLENGSVPLDVLEELVDAYIAERRAA